MNKHATKHVIQELADSLTRGPEEKPDLAFDPDAVASWLLGERNAETQRTLAEIVASLNVLEV